MKTKRQFLSMLLVCIVVLGNGFFVTAEETPAESTEKVVVTERVVPAEERERGHNRQMNEQLAKLGISLSDCECYDAQSIKPLIENISPKNDPNDYMIEYSEYRYPSSGDFLGGQPKGGTRITSGGSLFYVESGGPSVGFNVSFGGNFGSVSFSIPIGQQTATGGSVNIPSTGYWKIYGTKTYEVRSYVIYYKTYVDEFTGYIWKPYSGGYTKELYRSVYSPVRVD
ncbi:MAG: hypothetical protein IK016_10650 [Lachnospiraceae bacterium]|nr:hypothetical protein [Lachnospiraceae bacterium]